MLEVKICAGTHCSYRGGLDILEYLQNDETFANKIELMTSTCINHLCKEDNAPVVQVGDEIITNATLDKILTKIGEKL
jgi:NADH:ubiquinone oxidoreductase subunit E